MNKRHNSRCKIHLVSAARPNFVKIAPIYKVLIQQEWCEPQLICIKQHDMPSMSEYIANDLGIAEFQHHIHINNNVQFGERIGTIIERYSALLARESPHLVVVPGDVDASLAVAVAARRAGVAVAHLEAGLRSYDQSMPEELNRILIDAVSNVWLARNMHRGWRV